MSLNCKNRNSTTSQNHYCHQQTEHIITTNITAAFRHPLTNYPFFSRNPITMTVLSKPTPPATTKPPFNSTSNTMLAIAASISAKVIHPKPKQPQTTTNHAWTTAGRKTLPLNPPLLLPKTIPTKTTTSTHTPGTDFCIPLSIRFNNPSCKTHQISKHRLLTALLNAMHLIHPNANIGPRITDDTPPDAKPRIHDSDDIPTDDKALNHYLELPDIQNHDSFCARLLIYSDIDLHHYKKNQTLIQWLKEEGIQIDRNPIGATLKPQQIGFLTHITPRTDQTTMYEHRLQLATSPECPPFFLQAYYYKSMECLCKCDRLGQNHKRTPQSN
jgi:hypothetical protein